MNLYPCYLCGAKESTLQFDFRSRFVLKCNACGHIFNAPAPSAEVLKQFASQMYQGGIMPESSDMYANCFKGYKEDKVILDYRKTLSTLEKLIGFTRSGTATLLDVGCGTGVFLDIARGRGWRTLGVDLSDYATRYARDEFKLDVKTGDLLDEDYKNSSFDLITMWDFIEHVTNPIELIRRSYELLKPGGLILISTPNMGSFLTDVCGIIYSVNSGKVTKQIEKVYDIFHLSYFSDVTLRKVFEQNGLSVIYTKLSNPYLGRYRLGILNRLALSTIFLIANVIGKECRILMIGRK